MKNIIIESNKSPNFIGCWNIDNEDLCNDIIKFFDENPGMQTKGITTSGFDLILYHKFFPYLSSIDLSKFRLFKKSSASLASM